MKKIQGFTLIEVMVVVAVLAIIAAIALPSYEQYIRKKDLAVAQQEVQKIAVELERHKMRNFSFSNFCPSVNLSDANCSGNTFSVPANAPRYTIAVVDATSKDALTASTATGFTWAISATRIDSKEQAKNYDVLMKSDGTRCMTKIEKKVTEYTDCGTSSENW